MPHLDEGTIHAWLDGALSAGESAAAEAHVQGCAECAAAVADARGIIAGAARIVTALDTARGGVLPASTRTPPPRQASDRSLWRRLHLTPSRASIAAALLVAVAGTLVVRHQPSLDETMPPQRVVDSALPAATHEPPASVTPTKPETLNTKSLMSVPVQPQAAPPAAAGASRVRPAAEMNTARDMAGKLADPRVSREAFAAERSAGVAGDGCYQISSAPANGAFGTLPPRFELARVDTAGGTRNVVRALNGAGERGGVLPGMEWQQRSPAAVWILDRGMSPLRVVKLDLRPLRVAVTRDDGSADTAAVVRIDCSR